MKREHNVDKESGIVDKKFLKKEDESYVTKTEDNRTNESTFDRIYKYYHSNKTRIKLTDDEEFIRNRWEKAWLLLCRHRTRKQVVDLIVKLYNISTATAYDDIRHCMDLFSNPQADVKDAKRTIAETMAMKGADRCWKSGDMEGYHKFLKAYNDINQLEVDEKNDLGDLLKKLKPMQITIVASKVDLEKMAREMQDKLAHDIDYQDADD